MNPLIPQTPEDEEALEAIKALAQRIRSNAHLKVIIRAAKPELRRHVYYAIAKHITRFTPVPFDKKWAYE